MRLKQIEEAVRYGQKQKSEVKGSLNDYAFGFEIEMWSEDGHATGGDEDSITVPYDSLLDYIVEGDVHVGVMDYSDVVTMTEAIINANLELVDDESFYDNHMHVFFSDDMFNGLGTITDIDGGTADMFPLENYHAILSELISILSVNNGASDMDRDFGDVVQHINDGVTFSLLNKLYDEVGVVSNLTGKFKSYISILYKITHEIPEIYALNGDNLTPFSDLTDEEKENLDDVFNAEFMDNLKALHEVVVSIQGDSNYNDIETGDDYNSDTALIRSSAYTYLLEVDIIEADLRNLLEYHHAESTNDLESVLIELYNNDYFDGGSIEADFNDSQEESEGNSIVNDTRVIIENLSLNNSVIVKPEADGQVEIITETPVSGSDIIKHYDDMKKIIDALKDGDVPYYTNASSGLHMSISYKNGSKPINKNKFVLLSDLYHLSNTDESAIRNYVGDVFKILKDDIDDFTEVLYDTTNESMSTEIMDFVEGKIGHHYDHKYEMVNFSDYNNDGRVELRFFGGEGYEEKLDEYWDTLTKLMYILKISIENEHDTNYSKALFKVINSTFKKKTGMDIVDARYNMHTNKKLLDRATKTIEEISDSDIQSIERYVSSYPEYLDGRKGEIVSEFNTNIAKGSDVYYRLTKVELTNILKLALYIHRKES